MCLGDTNRQLGKTVIGISLDLLVGKTGVINLRRTVDSCRNLLDLFFKRRFVWIQEVKLVLVIASFDNCISQICGTCTTIGKVSANCNSSARFFGNLANRVVL